MSIEERLAQLEGRIEALEHIIGMGLREPGPAPGTLAHTYQAECEHPKHLREYIGSGAYGYVRCQACGADLTAQRSQKT